MVNGAIDLYVDGDRKNDVAQMLIGLKLLRDASEPQLQAAFVFVEQRHGLTESQVLAMLAR